MSNYGIKVSQAGYDVKTCAKERLIFSSKYDTLKLYSSGSGSMTVGAATEPWGPSGTETVTISHNLGYRPAFIVFCTGAWRTSSDFSPYAYKSIGGISPDGGEYAVDSTKLYIHLYNGDTAQRTIYYRYHIYYNEL